MRPENCLSLATQTFQLLLSHFVFQTHCARHRTPLLGTCGVCFGEDPLAITNPPARDKSLQLAFCWNCGSSMLLYDPEPPASPTVAEIIDLESAILTAVLAKSPNPRWSGRLCVKAFTEKLKFLMQHLTMTTATNDSLPLFCRIADADPMATFVLELRKEGS